LRPLSGWAKDVFNGLVDLVAESTLRSFPIHTESPCPLGMDKVRRPNQIMPCSPPINGYLFEILASLPMA